MRDFLCKALANHTFGSQPGWYVRRHNLIAAGSFKMWPFAGSQFNSRPTRQAMLPKCRRVQLFEPSSTGQVSCWLPRTVSMKLDTCAVSMPTPLPLTVLVGSTTSRPLACLIIFLFLLLLI